MKKMIEKLERSWGDIIFEACWKSFVAGFEWCRSKVGVHLFSPGTALPKIDPVDDSQRGEVSNHVQMFIKDLDLLPSLFHTDRASQTDPEVLFEDGMASTPQ